MRHYRGIYWVAAIGATTLALTGCSGGDGSEDGDASSDELTLSSVMGLPDYESIDYTAQQRAVEEAVAACMREQGWEYIPVEYPDMGTDVGEFSDEDELKRIEREGLGITYWTLNSGAEGGEFDDGWSDWTDPNEDYVMSLSDAEQEAYYESLYGPPIEIDYDTESGMAEDGVASIPAGVEDGGCYGEAQSEVTGDDLSSSPEFWDAMQPFYDDLQARIEADPRMAEIEESWAACMKDAGFDYENRNDFWESVYTEFDERQTEILGDDFYTDPFADWNEEQIAEFFETASQEEIDKVFAQPELTAEQRAGLEEVLADEIAIATADFTCSKPLNEKMDELYQEIEEQFVKENEDALRALAASMRDTK